MNPPRLCVTCGERVVWGEPDPCFGMLPGVKNACCGHGGEGYIQFENGVIVRFPMAATDHMMVCSVPDCPDIEDDRWGPEPEVIVNGERVHDWTWSHRHFPWGSTLHGIHPPEGKIE